MWEKIARIFRSCYRRLTSSLILAEHASQFTTCSELFQLMQTLHLTINLIWFQSLKHTAPPLPPCECVATRSTTSYSKLPAASMRDWIYEQILHESYDQAMDRRIAKDLFHSDELWLLLYKTWRCKRRLKFVGTMLWCNFFFQVLDYEMALTECTESRNGEKLGENFSQYD